VPVLAHWLEHQTRRAVLHMATTLAAFLECSCSSVHFVAACSLHHLWRRVCMSFFPFSMCKPLCKAVRCMSKAAYLALCPFTAVAVFIQCIFSNSCHKFSPSACICRYFARIADERMGADDQAILVTHQPRWLSDWFWDETACHNLRQLVRGHLRGRARVHLAGVLLSFVSHQIKIMLNFCQGLSLSSRFSDMYQ